MIILEFEDAVNLQFFKHPFDLNSRADKSERYWSFVCIHLMFILEFEDAVNLQFFKHPFDLNR